MAIVQEKRFDAPQPEVTETEYGAMYVKAATESPVVNEPEASPVVEAPVVESKDEATPKKRSGRPKKSNRK